MHDDDDYADESALFDPGATAQQIRSFLDVAPATFPLKWLSVLRVSQGFETVRENLGVTFRVLTTEELSRWHEPSWSQEYPAATDVYFPIAFDDQSGYICLDLKTVTPDGDCEVIRFERDDEFECLWGHSIVEFMRNSLNDSDWERLAPYMDTSMFEEWIATAAASTSDRRRTGESNQSGFQAACDWLARAFRRRS